MLKILIPKTSKEEAILTLPVIGNAYDAESGEVLGFLIDEVGVVSIRIGDITFIQRSKPVLNFYASDNLYEPVEDANIPELTNIGTNTDYIFITTVDYDTLYNAIYKELEITLNTN